MRLHEGPGKGKGAKTRRRFGGRGWETAIAQKKSGSDPGGSAMRECAIAAKVSDMAAMSDFTGMRRLLEISVMVLQ
jgi:hypothetical protein